MVTRSRARNIRMKSKGHHLLSMSGREKIKSANATKSRREQQLILAQAIVTKYMKDEEERNDGDWRNTSCRSMPTARQSPLWRVNNNPEELRNDREKSTGGQREEIECAEAEASFNRSFSDKTGIKGTGHYEADIMQFRHMLIENERNKMHEIQMPEVV